MTKTVSELLFGQNEIELYESYPYSKISSIHTGGNIAFLIYPRSEAALLYTVRTLTENGKPWRLIGNATNIIPPDEGTEKAVISTRRLRYVRADSKDAEVLCASCGCSLASLINFSQRHSLSGLERLFGIPATVGGAVYNNCGAFGCSISDFLHSVRLYDAKNDKTEVLSREEMSFSYRHSRLKELGDGKLILLDAAFKLKPDLPSEIERRKNKARDRKCAEQPTRERSAGSIFLKTGDTAPAYLIDIAGLKGLAVGGAEVSRKHAGFIINKNNAKSADIIALIELIKAEIAKKYGIHLICEVEIGD